MKSRLGLMIVLMIGMLMVIYRQDATARAGAVPPAGTYVSEAEALQALAHGRLIPTAGAAQPDNSALQAESSFALISQPDSVGSLLTSTGDIVFASDRSGPFSIFIQNVGSNIANPLINSIGNDATPVWSPDGTQMVFASDRDGNFEIYIRHADGSEQRLTYNTSADIHPSWSPDGTRILFSSNRSGSYYQAYTMNPDGSNVQPVGVVNNNVLYPRFSPDGNRIAFMRASIAIPACDWNWDIWVMDSNGNNQVRLTTHLGGDLFPNWTLDGRIIYASCRNFFNSDLYIIDPDSGTQVQVTNWAGSDELHAVFSPDEQHLAFNATIDGNYEVYIAPLSTGVPTNLTQNPASDLTPGWQGYNIPDPCAGANPSLQPVLLAPGWGAANTIGQDTTGFKQMLPYFQNMGYRLGCNLFYAGETSASLDLYENAVVIRDSVCQAYSAVKEFNPYWNGRMDIIGHSFGGLRARAFLEDTRWYDGQGSNGVYCQQPYPLPANAKLFIDNLFTLGSPHGGGTIDLPGALFIGLGHLFNLDEWGSIGELLFAMPTFNELHEQPANVCYRFVSGNAWAQPQTHITLGWLYSPIQKLIPNDLGVYRWSVYAPPNFWPEQYSNVVRSNTVDMHGYFWLLPNIQSFFYPASTFIGVIHENLGASMSRCQPTQAANQAQTYALETPALPMLVFAVDTVGSDATASGGFQLVESGATTIYLDWPVGELGMSLLDPQGNSWTPETADGDPDVEYLEMTIMSNVTSYAFTNTLTGTWSYTITAGALPYEVPFRLVALPERSISAMAASVSWQRIGQPVVITGTVQLADNTFLPDATVVAHISRPDGTIDVLPLFDDGAHHDGAANDGVYGNQYSETTWDGRYIVTVEVTGTYEDQAYARTADTLFTIAPNSASLAGQYSEQPQDDNGNGFYDWLDIHVGLMVHTTGAYFVAADLVTLDGEVVSRAQSHADLGGGASQMTLRFSGQAIADSGRDGPFWLTDVALVDVESGTVVVDQAINAYQTAAYSHKQFGKPPTVYLPFVTRR